MKVIVASKIVSLALATLPPPSSNLLDSIAPAPHHQHSSGHEENTKAVNFGTLANTSDTITWTVTLSLCIAAMILTWKANQNDARNSRKERRSNKQDSCDSEIDEISSLPPTISGQLYQAVYEAAGDLFDQIRPAHPSLRGVAIRQNSSVESTRENNFGYEIVYLLDTHGGGTESFPERLIIELANVGTFTFPIFALDENLTPTSFNPESKAPAR